MRAVSQKRLFWGFIGLALLLLPSINILDAAEPPNYYASHNESYTTQGNAQGMSDTLDCMMSQVITEERDFVPVLKCQFFHPGIVTYSLPLFADIDGDGETEVVAALENSPDGFAVINPNTCQAEHIVAVDGDIAIKDGGPVLGDVDSDGYVDIFIELDTKIQRWEYDPATGQIGMVWETPPWVATAERSHLDIWDINQDGTPEIIPNVGQMVNSVTGEIYPGALPLLHGQGKGVFAFTADADPGEAPQGQGNVELVYGTSIYRYDFINLEWVLVRSVPGFDWGFNANVSLADMDLDGDVDAVVSSWDFQGKAVIWDLQTTEFVGGGTFDYPGAWGSRPNIANMDQDPYPEIVMTSRYKIFAVDDVVTTGSFGNIIWLDETSDESGHTQITSFDFDGNGTYEAVYRDETRLRIFSGMGTGIPTNGYPSGPRVLLDSGDDQLCRSFTGLEYPTIGDLDNDNEAEIVATCEEYVSIYESGSLPWGDASKVWNTQAFSVTNVNQDGTILAVVTENYTIYNNFLAQVNIGPVSDTIYAAIPDGYIEIQSVTNNCDGTVAFEVLVCNQGANSLPTGTPIAFYWSDPTENVANLVYTTTLTEDLDIGNCIELNSSDIEAPEGLVTLYGVVNDDGQQVMPYVLDHVEHGGSFPLTSINECDYTNNMADTTILVGASDEILVNAEICEGDSYTIGDQVYTEAGTHTFTNINGDCEEITTVILTVLPNYEQTFAATICQGQSYPMANQEFATHGTHQIVLQTQDGCDSLLTLELTVLPAVATTLAATICEGEVYELGGIEYTESGTYTNSLTSIYGCDSTSILELTVLPSATTALSATICAGEEYEFGGTTYTTSGTYTNVLSAEGGCENTEVLDLIVLDTIETSISATICEGDTYTFGNSDFSENGVYRHTYSSASGCDSSVVLTLAVAPSIQEQLVVSICEGESYEFGDASYSTSGDYNFTFTAASGCDSSVALQLIVEEVSVHSINTTICAGESFSYAGTTYSEAGTHTFELTNAFGCDSLVLLTIIEQESFQTEEEAIICAGESYHLGSGIYTKSGIYEEVFQSEGGCDSSVVLQLEVLEAFNEVINQDICDGEAYMIGSTAYEQAGTYIHQLTATNGCDSNITLTLNILENSWSTVDMTLCEGESAFINGETVNGSGIFYENLSNVQGCDSLVEYIVEVIPQIEIWGTEVVICKGESVKLEAFGATDIKWDYSADLSCTDCLTPTATPLYTSTYRFTATGCMDTELEGYATVEVSGVPEIDAGPDVTVPPGQAVDLKASTPGNMDQNITWENIYRELICENCPEVTVFPETNTAYIASIVNDAKCEARDTVNVTLRSNCITEDFFVPNMITPNGDGANDFFQIEADSDFQVKWLRIYNRWGEMVFSTTDLSNQWDGSHRGKPLNPGVYVYYLEVHCPDNKPYQKFGNITLIK